MLCLVVVGSTIAGWAQLSVVNTERLPLDATRQWSQPRFSADGARLYMTSPDYAGIWEFTLASASLRQITDDAGSGYSFALSDDGTLLAYRRTIVESGRKRQEIVLRRLAEPSETVIADERKLSVPAFSGTRVLYLEQPALEKTSGADAGEVTLLGIEQTKIALRREGTVHLLDPLGTGRYIWPALSPDRQRIAAVQMERGALVMDLGGALLALLGKCNAPSWTRDGRWLIGMDDRDDGHQVISSELVFVSVDGKSSGALTASSDVMEMYPDCSPVDNRIAYATLSGEVFVLTYQEEGR